MAGLRLILVVFCFVAGAKCATLIGKELFCRDPDSGKLHAVNTTWVSTSFCGNYTCKQRKRNITLADDTLIRQLNVTNIKNQKTDKNKNVTIESKIEPDIEPILHIDRVPEPKNSMIDRHSEKPQGKTDDVSHKYFEEKQAKKPKKNGCKIMTEILKSYEDGDRYLTEKEINNIAGLLRKVKKSDLDAVVDIYNLAQDIYNEMDKDSDTELVNEALNLIIADEKQGTTSTKPSKYWYDPFANKGRVADMDVPKTRIVQSTVKPKTHVPIYFNGALSSNDFGKLPYYYPVTPFQRTSSYTHTSNLKAEPKKVNTEAKPKLNKPKNDPSNTPKGRRPISASQKLFEQFHLLPYPSTHYNFSKHPNNFYYHGNPWTWDYYNRYKHYQPHFNTFISPNAVPKAVLVNPRVSNEIQDIAPTRGKTSDKELLKNYPIRSGKKLPRWKTKPISIEVLKDIKANLDTSRIIKAFPLRKQITLERVNKAIISDEQISEKVRSKRSIDVKVPEKEIVNDFGKYETYIERVMCEAKTQPGFFRYGNMSQPYPHCCPQLIKTR